MKILGIDPGTATTGFAVIEKKAGRLIALDYGVITTPAGMDAAHRLLLISDDLTELIEQHQPKKLIIEKLFFTKNVTTGIAVAEARGVVLSIAAHHGLSITEFTPNHIKKAVTGSGAAKKPQVQKMVQQIYNLPELPQPDDAADALAIAFAGL